MSGYTLTSIRKEYGPRTVLAIGQLCIPAGRTLAVLGPSGAGKSTLLRLLNFLEPPDAGELCFAGEPVRRFPPPLPLRRAVTTVFQRSLLLNSSVWDNVRYGLWLRGRYEREKVAAALEEVGLTHLARARARTLSAGEAQRVALARALVIEPRVLLLDEPTANLDPSNVATIERVLRGMQARGTTIVIVTHNLFQARRLAHEGILLIEGTPIEHGAIARLFDAPEDPRTAAFLQGTMVY